MKLWGGRFSKEINGKANDFNSSFGFDKRLYKHDITGSIAYAKMLGKQGIISEEDSILIIKSLESILGDIESGTLSMDSAHEDIHSFVEAELVKRIGEAGKRLHTGRSRNDQTALDMRMYVKDEINEVSQLIIALMEVLLKTIEKHFNTIMPGFTHMQKAQPVTLAHHLMAYVEMFKRDYERLRDSYKRTDIMPLGSGALASTVFNIDREFLREKLGFSSISANSMDAVSDRDFCIEYLSCLSLVMMHLSRFCEELIIWSTDSFNFISISDDFSTGSSIMPQKKNPDIAELIRGKTGRVYGSLMGLLTMMKGLPLSYNKDMQEDKEAVFDASDTVKTSLSVFTSMFSAIEFYEKTMYESTLSSYTNATDAADWLVKKGLAFRDAHEITGKLVLYAIDKNIRIEELSADEIKNILNEKKDIFDNTFFDAISIEKSVEARSLPGGPAESAMKIAVENARRFIENVRQV